eukprot:1912129-Pyramimonas_sp.AAC.1
MLPSSCAAAPRRERSWGVRLLPIGRLRPRAESPEIQRLENSETEVIRRARPPGALARPRG